MQCSVKCTVVQFSARQLGKSRLFCGACSQFCKPKIWAIAWIIITNSISIIIINAITTISGNIITNRETSCATNSNMADPLNVNE